MAIISTSILVSNSALCLSAAEQNVGRIKFVPAASKVAVPEKAEYAVIEAEYLLR